MKTLLTVLVLAVPAAFAVPPNGKGKPKIPGQRAASAGQSAEKNAAKKCKAERKAIGVEAFKQKYGKNVNRANALGRCVSVTVKKSY